jgi:uncharacterized membrane protein
MRQYGQILVKTAFRATITTKGIDGLFEIMGGACLWFIHSSAMSSILGILLQHELSHDPRDFIAIHLLRTSMLLSANKVFASIFLLSHGVTKVILVIALWRNAPWAYPLTIVLFGVFGAYQMYRFSHAHSIPMLLFTISDVFLIFLTLREWQTRIS